MCDLNSAEKLPLLIQRLEEAYGRPSDRRGSGGVGVAGGEKRSPLDTLILTILSQATTDDASLKAFANLKRRFDSWLEVLGVEVRELEERIRVAGLAPTKANRIKRILEGLYEEHGELSLDFLKDFDREDAFDYLTSLPGVGSKTAACVLLFSLDKPAFPVDTHVSRVLKRLGLASPTDTPDRIRSRIEPRLQFEAALSLHLNLLRFGREVCRSRRPRCHECNLRSICVAGTRGAEEIRPVALPPG